MKPTIAKLIGAVFFALTALAVERSMSQAFVLEGNLFSQMLNNPRLLMVPVGFILGWRMIGAKAGRTVWLSITQAFFAAVVLVVLSVFTFAFIATMDQSINGSLRGLERALETLARSMLAYGRQYAAQHVAITLVSGTVITGIVTHVTFRLWK